VSLSTTPASNKTVPTKTVPTKSAPAKGTGAFPSGRWQLHHRVALRPEPFGALAYHYDSRRLNFLRSPDLVHLVKTMHNHPSPKEAFEAAGFDCARWPGIQRALASLADSEFLIPVTANGPTPGPTANPAEAEAG